MLRDTEFRYNALLRIRIPKVAEISASIPESRADSEAERLEEEYRDAVREAFEDYLSQDSEATVTDIELEDLYAGEFCVSVEVSCEGVYDRYEPLDRFESPSCESYPDVSESDLERYAADGCASRDWELVSADISEI